MNTIGKIFERSGIRAMMSTGKPEVHQHASIIIKSTLLWKLTYTGGRLRHAYRGHDPKDLPKEVEQNPLLRGLQEQFVRLDEARFTNEVENLCHDAVTFQPAPLQEGVSHVSTNPSEGHLPQRRRKLHRKVLEVSD